MILAVSIGNFFFSIFSGQPLVILGATGPTIIFERLIFTFCSTPGVNIPFLEFRFWVGLWTSLFIFILVGLNSSAIVRLVTRFTGEIVSALISFVFIWEALSALWKIHLNYPYNQWILRPTIMKQCDCYQFRDLESLKNSNLSNASRLGSYWDVRENDCSVGQLRKFLGSDCLGDLFSSHDVFLMSVILFFGTFILCFYLKKFRRSKVFKTIVSIAYVLTSYIYKLHVHVQYSHVHTMMNAVCVRYVLHMVTRLHVHDYASVHMRKRGIR